MVLGARTAITEYSDRGFCFSMQAPNLGAPGCSAPPSPVVPPLFPPPEPTPTTPADSQPPTTMTPTPPTPPSMPSSIVGQQSAGGMAPAQPATREALAAEGGVGTGVEWESGSHADRLSWGELLWAMGGLIGGTAAMLCGAVGMAAGIFPHRMGWLAQAVGGGRLWGSLLQSRWLPLDLGLELSDPTADAKDRIAEGEKMASSIHESMPWPTTGASETAGAGTTGAGLQAWLSATGQDERGLCSCGPSYAAEARTSAECQDGAISLRAHERESASDTVVISAVSAMLHDVKSSVDNDDNEELFDL